MVKLKELANINETSLFMVMFATYLLALQTKRFTILSWS